MTKFRLKHCRRGASGLEYGLLAGLVAVASILAVQAAGTSVADLLSRGGERISGAAVGETAGAGGEAGGPASIVSETPPSGGHPDAPSLSYEVAYDEPVVATGTPKIVLDVSGTPIDLTLASGSGTDRLLFQGTVPAGLSDGDGLAVVGQAIQLDGGAITQADGGGDAALALSADLSDATIGLNGLTETFQISEPAPHAGTNNFFGIDIDMHAGQALIAAPGSPGPGTQPGAAYLVSLNATTVHRYVAPAGVSEGGFAQQVALSDAYAVATGWGRDGAGGEDNVGAVYVFDRQDDQLEWTIRPPTDAADQYFGHAVAIDGDTLVVGARGDSPNGSSAGAAYVYELGSSTPTTPAQTLYPDPVGTGGAFGSDVAVAGDVVLVGATHYDVSGVRSGAAFVFDAASGVQQRALYADTPELTDYSGRSVALNGGTALVNKLDDTGAVQMFDVSTGAVETMRVGPDTRAFSQSIAAEPGRVVAAAPYETNFRGSVYAFDPESRAFTHRMTASDAQDNDIFGWHGLAVDAGTVMVGVPERDSWTGAVYVYALP